MSSELDQLRVEYGLKVGMGVVLKEEIDTGIRVLAGANTSFGVIFGQGIGYVRFGNLEVGRNVDVIYAYIDNTSTYLTTETDKRVVEVLFRSVYENGKYRYSIYVDGEERTWTRLGVQYIVEGNIRLGADIPIFAFGWWAVDDYVDAIYSSGGVVDNMWVCTGKGFVKKDSDVIVNVSGFVDWVEIAGEKYGVVCKW